MTFVHGAGPPALRSNRNAERARAETFLRCAISTQLQRKAHAITNRLDQDSESHCSAAPRHADRSAFPVFRDSRPCSLSIIISRVFLFSSSSSVLAVL